jgi:hypothetical protein
MRAYGSDIKERSRLCLSKLGSRLWNRFTVRYTPKHRNWLNQAEIAISLFPRQDLVQRRIGDRVSLRKETRRGTFA